MRAILRKMLYRLLTRPCVGWGECMCKWVGMGACVW